MIEIIPEGKIKELEKKEQTLLTFLMAEVNLYYKKMNKKIVYDKKIDTYKVIDD